MSGHRKDRIDLAGAGWLVFFSLLMGLNQVIIKLVNAGLAPVFQAGLRSVCAFVPVLAYALVTRKRLSVRDGSFFPGLLCGSFFAMEFMLMFTALEYTSVSRASVMFYTMPFWVALVAHFLIAGEQLTLARSAGLALAVAGIAWALSTRDATGHDDATLLGDVMCLIAAMFWAGIALLARLTPLSRSSPEMQLLYQLGVSPFILLPAALASGDLVREFTSGTAVLFVFQVLVVVSFGFLMWFRVLAIYPASDMASWSFLTPLFGVFFGWFILDEQLSWQFAGAIVLVCTGIMLVNRKPGRMAKSLRQPP